MRFNDAYAVSMVMRFGFIWRNASLTYYAPSTSLKFPHINHGRAYVGDYAKDNLKSDADLSHIILKHFDLKVPK